MRSGSDHAYLAAAVARLSALYVYPVKSCRGLAVTSAAVDACGLVGDRRFLVVDADGRFLTQRVHPRMALIETRLTADTLTLTSPGHGFVSVPLRPESANIPQRTVTVWHDTVTAGDAGDVAAAWLSDFLELPCRLVRSGPDYRRPIPGGKLPPALAADGSAAHEVSFADAYPFLLVSEASLADLNGRLEIPLPMDRFRPNLVVAGVPPYAEDAWGRLRIGDVVFHGTRCCIRCVVTTTDQTTAARGVEPLRTLATYRRVADEGVKFGRNLLHETKHGRLHVGDSLQLLDA